MVYLRMPLDTLQGQMILVDEILQRDHQLTLRSFLEGGRDDGVSFDTLARRLSELIDINDFTVSYQTIRRWCRRFDIEVAS